MARRNNNGDSVVKTVFLVLVAAIVLITAIWVVVSVFGKISSDYKQLELTTAEETTEETIEIEKTEKQGWNDTDEGWKYLMDDGIYAADQWLEIEGFLYYFDDQGIMVTGQWEQEGQKFTCHDTKGYLKDIQADLNYVPKSTGEDLDSLVRTNAFWCYLDSESQGIFKTILYRKTVENKVMPLGDEDFPEKTTRNSMRAVGDYVYYLPKVTESQTALLSESEKSLCNTLFRMIPGQKTKELIAKDVGGYLVLDDTIYYSQNGKIYSAKSGTEMASGQGEYSVVIKDDSCYILDSMGNPVVPEDGSSIYMGDRVYRIESDGKIKYVKRAQITVGNVTYYLGGSGTKGEVCGKTDTGDKTFIKEEYGVQSYCIVDNYIYYSTYVDKNRSGEWYSQIFRTDLGGMGKKAVSGKFSGAMENMYYFEETDEIYGEYHPAIWKQAYGVAVLISRDGRIYRISDGSARIGKYVSGNDMLELVALQNGELICLWHDCEWSRTGGITKVLWSKAVSLNVYSRTEIDMVSDEDIDKPEETEAETEQKTETEAVIKPIETKPIETTKADKGYYPIQPSASPADGPDGDAKLPTQAPVQAPTKQEVILGTDGPGKEHQITVPPTTAQTKSSEDIQIIPLE